MTKNIEISIIIVHYKVKDLLFNCLRSIYGAKQKYSFEVIVVDNDERNTLEKELIKNFPKVKYIKSEKNIGFGAGNNLGAEHAKGKYLFFLNPDTELKQDTINSLYGFLNNDEDAGIVSPLILNEYGDTFNLQGYQELTPLRALLSFTYLKTFFFKFSIFSNYSIDSWRKIPIRAVNTCYGAALMIPSVIFKKVNGFDENFFLYFEENDISKRVRDLGYKVFINSNSRLIHKVGRSTKQIENKDQIFSQSRFLYLDKHYGYIPALIVGFLIDIILKINKITVLLAIVIFISIFLRLYNISQGMVFIGDQGWFYLSARDLLISGKIPLVGITSSHTWLHQGPLWTYMLSVALFLFRFNPLAGGYLTVLFGTMSTYLMFKVGSLMFSKKAGLISAFLFAVSPLVVLIDRMPFDPTPIPFFTILYFFAIFKWLKGNINYFPFIILLIALLYNLELATFTLFFPLLIILIYGFIRKKNWVTGLLNKKTFFYTFIALIVPMFPVIIYDFSNGFKQTIVFMAWIIYKPFSFLIKHPQGNLSDNLKTMSEFFGTSIQQLLFQSNLLLALIILISSMVILTYSLYRIKKIEISNPRFILFLFLIFSLGGIVVNQAPSAAYLPITFPFVIFAVALAFEMLSKIKKIGYLFDLIVILLVVFNIWSSIQNDLINGFMYSVKAVDKIINLTKGQSYNLIGKGAGSQFESFTMNYEYLLWWKGKPPSQENVRLKIYLSEDNNKVTITKKDD